MGILNRMFGIEQAPETPVAYVPNTEKRFQSENFLPPSRNEIVVNTASALTLIPVSRSISVLETAAMQIPIDVYRGEEQIASPAWIETPDIENNVSRAEWIGSTVVHLAQSGNAFWYITRGARGISNVRILHPELVSITSDTYGKYIYNYNGTQIPSENIKHIKLWSKPNWNSVLGEGPIQRHKYILRSALDLQDYADNWFRRSGVPTGILSTPEFLSEDVAVSNKKAFIESQRERSVAVLSNGLAYDNISLNPEEAQFLENQKFVTRQIANMFGVPSIYLGLSIEGQGMTYTNGNEDRNKLYEDGLQPYLVRIEQAISDLLPRGQEAKFNLTQFLRPNQLVRFQSYAIALDKQFMTPNEVRELEGMQMIAGGDSLIAPASNANIPSPQPGA